MIFFGTDLFAKELLRFLFDHIEIAAVVTQEDQPQGRNRKVCPPPVKALCLERNFTPIYQPVKASDPEFLQAMRDLHPNLFIVASYGQILCQPLLDIPKIGTINVHPRILTKYRGPSPIQTAILEGERETGVSIMEMVLAMDAGGVIEVVTTPIAKGTTYGQLEESLCTLAKEPLLRVIKTVLQEKKIHATPQDEKKATYTKKIHVEDSYISWNRPADVVCRFIHGMNPRPGARCKVVVDGQIYLLKVLKAQSVDFQGEAGEILFFDKTHGCVIGCSQGAVSLLDVQMEGKKPMTIKDFMNGLGIV